MAEQRSLVGFFQALITEQVIQLAAGVTVGAMVAGPAGAVAVPLAAKAIEYYGIPIATNLLEWIRRTPPSDACLVLADVANLSAPDALRMAQTAVSTAMPNASEASQTQLTSYLAGVSASLRQSLPRGDNGLSTCPAALLPRTQEQALRMLPVHLPPFQAPCDLPGTDYRLVRLLGTGGFGAVYEAHLRNEPDTRRALKFCLDPERVNVLKHELRGFERVRALANKDRKAWPEGVVRLYGENLQHATPFLIFEYVSGGDLGLYRENHRVRAKREMSPEEILLVMMRIASAVVPLHKAGVTHCDLKPANILFDDDEPRIADLGLGAVNPNMASNVSRQRTRTATVLDLRGAGTYLYSAPEQLRGAAPLPTQDIYSLGVIWYQLLIDDFTRAPGPSWRKQLASKGVPEPHLAVLETCLEELPQDRPADASVLAERLIDLRRATDTVFQRQKAEEVARQQATQQADRDFEEAKKAKKPELLQAFVDRYPQHPRHAEAKQNLAMALREALIAKPKDKALRQRYLAVRTPELLAADLETGFSWMYWGGVLLIIALHLPLYLSLLLYADLYSEDYTLKIMQSAGGGFFCGFVYISIMNFFIGSTIQFSSKQFESYENAAGEIFVAYTVTCITMTILSALIAIFLPLELSCVQVVSFSVLSSIALVASVWNLIALANYVNISRNIYEAYYGISVSFFYLEVPIAKMLTLAVLLLGVSSGLLRTEESYRGGFLFVLGISQLAFCCIAMLVRVYCSLSRSLRKSEGPLPGFILGSEDMQNYLSS